MLSRSPRASESNTAPEERADARILAYVKPSAMSSKLRPSWSPPGPPKSGSHTYVVSSVAMLIAPGDRSLQSSKVSENRMQAKSISNRAFGSGA